MTPTTKTRISNRKQIWRHNSWWNLRGKLPMEWVICLQNLWVAQKKRNKKTNSSQKRYTLLRRTVLAGLFFIQCHFFKLLFLRGANIFVTPAGELFHFWRYHLFLFFFLSWVRQSLCIIVGYLILDLNCFRFPSYHFRLSIFIYYFKDDLNKAFPVYFV